MSTGKIEKKKKKNSECALLAIVVTTKDWNDVHTFLARNANTEGTLPVLVNVAFCNQLCSSKVLRDWLHSLYKKVII